MLRSSLRFTGDSVYASNAQDHAKKVLAACQISTRTEPLVGRFKGVGLVGVGMHHVAKIARFAHPLSRVHVPYG